MPNLADIIGDNRINHDKLISINSLKMLNAEESAKDGYNEFGKLGEMVTISNVVLVSGEPLPLYGSSSKIVYDMNGINFDQIQNGKVSFQLHRHGSGIFAGGLANGRLENGKAVADISILNDGGNGTTYLRQISNGFANGTSIGYSVDERRDVYEYDDDGYFKSYTLYADKITILELSQVDVPRDNEAFIMGYNDKQFFNSITNQNEGKKMPEPVKNAVPEQVQAAKNTLINSLMKNGITIGTDESTAIDALVEEHSKLDKFNEFEFALAGYNAGNAGFSAKVAQLQEAMQNQVDELNVLKEAKSLAESQQEFVNGYNVNKSKVMMNKLMAVDLDARKHLNIMDGEKSIYNSIVEYTRNGNFVNGADEYTAAMDGAYSSDVQKSINELSNNNGIAIPVEAMIYRSAILSNDTKILNLFANAYSVTGDSGTKGGVLVDTETLYSLWQDRLFITALQQKLGIMMMTGLTSNIAIPQMGAKIAISILTESAALTATDTTITAVTTSPKRLGAQIEKTLLLQLQTGGAIDMFIFNSLLASLEEKHYLQIIQGSGTNGELTGIANQSGITTETMPFTAAPSNDRYVEYEDTIKGLSIPERQNTMMDNQQALFNTGLTDTLQLSPKLLQGNQTIMGDDRSMVRGMKVTSTNALNAPAADSNVTGIIGDFGTAFSAEYGTTKIIVDPYSKAGQATEVCTINKFCDLIIGNKAKLALFQNTSI